MKKKLKVQLIEFELDCEVIENEERIHRKEEEVKFRIEVFENCLNLNFITY